MTGLTILGLLGIAIAFLIWITRAGARAGSRAWGSRWGGLGGGALVLLLATSPLTWDTIPTLIAYRQACNTVAIVIHKSSNQWRVENPESTRQIGPLRSDEPAVVPLSDGGRMYRENNRFAQIFTLSQTPFLKVETMNFIDFATKEVLVTNRTYTTGKGELKIHDRIRGLDDFKVWLNLPPCLGQSGPDQRAQLQFPKIGDSK